MDKADKSPFHQVVDDLLKLPRGVFVKDLANSTLNNENIRTRIIIAPVDRAAQAHMLSIIKHLNPDAEVIMLDSEPMVSVSDVANVVRAQPVIDPIQVASKFSTEADLGRLSKRQREVLEHLVVGQTNKEIARSLGISPSTVRVHVSALLRTLDVSSRTAAAATFAASSISSSEAAESHAVA